MTFSIAAVAYNGKPLTPKVDLREFSPERWMRGGVTRANRPTSSRHSTADQVSASEKTLPPINEIKWNKYHVDLLSLDNTIYISAYSIIIL